ncbi:hypothetical protein L1S34_04250 [Flavobacterium sp. K77]|uniref:hypothetical protein n=1 Tax=Flavobacterium sp. K77 TaxID=2910676 RepID=UPI001F1DEE83|nr:hypothetical protein [Flavobacterium sp. K77]MCF6140489.1 hypothetical protein [Flavobacterium sp. K77]
MNSVSCKSFRAQVTIGLNIGYTTESISIETVKHELAAAQQVVKKELNVVLSTKIRTCEIVFLGQEEPSVELEFIQYPKFIQEEALLKKAILKLTELMMMALQQNRVVIVFNDDTIMLEKSEEIDPNIEI